MMQTPPTNQLGRNRNRDWWDRTWKNKRGQVVIYQRPNAVLITWVILTIISLLIPSQTAENVVYYISDVVLAIWSLLEIFKGVDYFRRALGVVVLLLCIATAFGVGL